MLVGLCQSLRCLVRVWCALRWRTRASRAERLLLIRVASAGVRRRLVLQMPPLWENTEQFWYVNYAPAAVLDPSARRLELDEPLTKCHKCRAKRTKGGRIQSSKSGIRGVGFTRNSLEAICVFLTKRVYLRDTPPPINRRGAVSRSPRTATTQSRHCTRIVFPLVRTPEFGGRRREGTGSKMRKNTTNQVKRASCLRASDRRRSIKQFKQ